MARIDLSAKLATIQASIERNAKAQNEVVKADSRHEITENIVTKSNALCRAYYRYGLVPKRCMEAMIGQLDSRLADREQLQDVRLTAVDYANAYGVDSKIAYRDLESAVEKLMHEVITVHEMNRKIQYTLMSRAEYLQGTGEIIANFNPMITRHLIGLREKFASYPLLEAVEFKSSYTWRFYELMVSWAQDKKHTGGLLAGWFTVEVDEFRKMMGAPDSFQWVHVRERIIERSQQELIEAANIHLGAEYIKKGRKITHIKFQFVEDEQQKLDF
ncbi:MAG: replication initiation protein [Thiomicrospira sp.]